MARRTLNFTGPQRAWDGMGWDGLRKPIGSTGLVRTAAQRLVDCYSECCQVLRVGFWCTDSTAVAPVEREREIRQARQHRREENQEERKHRLDVDQLT
jgi:hypothetical protein